MAGDPSDQHDDATAQPGRDLRLDAAHDLRGPGRGETRQRPAMASATVHGQHGAANEPAFTDEDAGDHDSHDAFGKNLAEADVVTASPLMLAQHAADLADRLQQRLAEVDRRESRLNSQEAEFDSRIRNARLWIDQRDSELTEREQLVGAAEQDLAERQEVASLQFAEAAELAERLKELTEREKSAAEIQLELELGRTELQTKLDSLDFETAACRTRQQELDQAKQRFEQRQRELDAREARLYVEQERLTADRIETDGRETTVTRRESTFLAKEAGLQECERRLVETAGALEFERAELHLAVTAHEKRVAELEANERRIEYRQREISTALERFERLGIVEQRIADVERQSSELAMRAAYLDDAEAMLAERQLQFSELQRELKRQRAAFENQVTKERRAQVAESEIANAQAAERTRELERRDAALDQRERALEEIAEQLRTTQRESLEMRLATEETWQQLQGVLAPAALARSIAMVRGRLAEHYQFAADEVRKRRDELEAVRGELAEQFAALEGQRRELERWAAGRNQDVEKQSAVLVARERELDAQQREYEARERIWGEERQAYQEEIQRLLAGLRTPARVAA